jgi:hypothetical protein
MRRECRRGKAIAGFQPRLRPAAVGPVIESASYLRRAANVSSELLSRVVGQEWSY